jgi:Ni/Co efflux regulator RcnB
MKRIAISAFAICIAMAVPTALLADDHKDQGNTHATSGQTQGTHGSTNGSSGQHGSTGGSGQQGSMGGATHYRHSNQSTGGMTGPTYHSYQYRNNINTAGHMATGHHPVVDVSHFRRNVTAERHFHFRDYHGPRDYAYRRWSYGENLPREYWAQDYWIANFLNFGLDAPPDGYVWVQYGNDALLIDEDTGEIIEVEYGIFY